MEYNVIWIDDEWDTRGASFIRTCKLRHHILIDAYKTRKQGMEALEGKIEKIDAIILDAKAYNNSDEEEPDVDGLFQAKDRIAELRSRKYIPTFIFTRQPDLFSDKMFEKSVGKFYRKDEEGQRQLIEDLKLEVEKSPRYQVKCLYHDALSQLYSMNTDAGENVLNIFEAMHFPSAHPDFNPLNHYNQLRQILEYNFREAKKYGVIPDCCFDDNEDPILGECSRYLNGKETKYTKVKVRYDQEGKKIVPPHIELLIRMILEIGNINSHSTKLSDSELQELGQYFNKNVFNSRYLIYSLALNACEITLWFKNYIDSHQDIEANKKKCHPIPIEQTTSMSMNEMDNNGEELTGVIELHDGIYHIGDKFYLNPKTIQQRGWLGKKVKVIEKDINTNSDSREKYPFFACKVQPVTD